jgi:Short C-terminal domain
MTMQRLSRSRGHRTDLLARPPCTARDLERGWAALFVDPIDQLKELADLRIRGLLSREEFDRQKAKVIDP